MRPLTVSQRCILCHYRTYHRECCVSHRDSGYLVRVPRLLVYMCPPTSMWTGALVLVSLAGLGMPIEPKEDRETSCWLNIVLRLSWDINIHSSGISKWIGVVWLSASSKGQTDILTSCTKSWLILEILGACIEQSQLTDSLIIPHKLLDAWGMLEPQKCTISSCKKISDKAPLQIKEWFVFV